jgi:uncharacterized OsmC-like protein
MGIAARTHDLNMTGTECEVEKIMVSDPRRIGEIKIRMTMSADHAYTDKDKKILEHAAMNCPVIHSLHPDITKTISFSWP